MTQKEFGEIMARFHRDKWIESGPSNTVILHARAIVEMQSFLHEAYRDFVHNCQICTRILIRGLNCSNTSCDIHLHRSCAARYFLRLSNASNGGTATTRKAHYPCPACKQEWKKSDVDRVLHGKDSTNDENNARQSTATASKKQRTSRASNSTRSSHTRSSNRRIDEEEDEDDD